MMQKNRSAQFLLISSLLLGSGCGWHLRGADTAHPSLAGSSLEEQTKTQQTTVISPATETETTEIVEDTKAEPAIATSQENQKSNEGFSLHMRERNHDLAIALNRIAWENKTPFIKNGGTVLVIDREKLEKRPLTVTETGVAAQYQLILTITFSRQRADGSLVAAPQQITSWRSYDFDPKLILAKAQEEEALLIEMREELARRMLLVLQKPASQQKK